MVTLNGNNIELILSRNSYPLKSSVIGTVTVPDSEEIASLQLYVAGRCRLDSRWHDDIPIIQKVYGTHPCHAEIIPPSVEQAIEDGYFHKSTVSGARARNADASVCFWSTNVVTLYQFDAKGSCIQVPLVENGDPMEDDSLPKPLQLRGSEWFQNASKMLQMKRQNREENENHGDDDLETLEEDVSFKEEIWGQYDEDARHQPSFDDLVFHPDVSDSNDIHSDSDIQERQLQPLHFTFRADLTADIPVTVHAVSARIFYSAVMYAITKEGKSIVLQAPFTVTSSDDPTNDPMPSISKTKISIGSLYAVAHTKPYLVDLSPTYKSEPWNVTLQRQNPRFHPLQTVEIQDKGIPCCVLSILGGGILSPGDFLHLKFDFSTREDERIPCHQVSACIQGNEWVISSNGEKKKARSYLFDTDHFRVIPETTEMVSLRLQLPLDCPVSVSTGYIHIDISCRIDLTVKRLDAKNRYRFLTVEFPCLVNQCEPGYEPMENDLPTDLENDLYQIKWWDNNDQQSVVLKNIVTAQVLNDLRMLSLLAISK